MQGPPLHWNASCHFSAIECRELVTVEFGIVFQHASGNCVRDWLYRTGGYYAGLPKPLALHRNHPIS
jgi:hypothetical protein